MTKVYKDQSYFQGTSPKSIKNSVIETTVDEIIAIAKDRLKKPSKTMRVLDVGAGWGEYTFAINDNVQEIIAVEPYKKLYVKALKNKKIRRSKVKFYNN